MSHIIPEHATVPPQQDISPQPDIPQDTPAATDITLSQFYHCAINAVTKPNKATFLSNYFIDRWMPLLGGNATMLILALRRDGFLNRKTGERRDEIVISRAELACAAGISEDTLTREMGISKKNGKPNNPWLHVFVQKRLRNRRDRLGRVWREENAYWIAMDDPIHPDDWHLVEQAVHEAEERLEKQPPTPGYAPKTQNASSAASSANPGPARAHFPRETPKTHFAPPGVHFAPPPLRKMRLPHRKMRPLRVLTLQDKNLQKGTSLTRLRRLRPRSPRLFFQGVRETRPMKKPAKLTSAKSTKKAPLKSKPP